MSDVAGGCLGKRWEAKKKEALNGGTGGAVIYSAFFLHGM